MAVESLHDRAGGVECPHRMSVVGYLSGVGAGRVLRRRGLRPSDVPGFAPPGAPSGCARQLLVECRDCGDLRAWACRNHRESACRPCASRYRRYVLRVADAGITHHHGRSRVVTFLTLTAPSQSPHQRYIPGRRGRHGDCSCWVPDLARWNADQSSYWNRLRTALSREVPGFDYFRAVEVQDGKRGGEGRGALHLHVLVVSDGPLDILRVHELAIASGFGCVLDPGEPITPGSRKAARYVAKYVSKACDSRHVVPWLRLDSRTGEFSDRATYRTWSSSRSWGCTMAEVVSASCPAPVAKPASMCYVMGHGPDVSDLRPPATAPPARSGSPPDV